MLQCALVLALSLGLAESLKVVSTGPYYWTGKNGDLLRTGASEYGVIQGALATGPAWSWHETGNDLVRAAPLIDDHKNIYLSTITGHVHKFSPDGVVLWSYNDTREIPEVPCLYNGAMFFTNTAGTVTKLDMESGLPIFRVSALVVDAKGSAGDTWSMTAGEGVVISAVSSSMAHNNYVVGLDAETGAVKWNFEPDEIVYNSLQDIKDGSVMFSDCTGKVYRLNLQSGELIWKAGPGAVNEAVDAGFSTGGTVMGSNGVLYTTSNALQGGQKSGFVTAFNFSDGTMLWRRPTEYQANNGAAVGMMNGRLAVAIGVGENPELPDPVKQTVQLMRDNNPSLTEKKARVVALDAITGEELWRHELTVWHGWAAGDTILPFHVCLPDSFGNPALAGDGTVYVGFESGAFYGINDRNGDGTIDEGEVSMYDTHNAFQGSPALAPGMVVATPCNGLHVFKASL